MKELDIHSRLYKKIIPQVVGLLLKNNDITTMFSDAELGPYEQAMLNRVFGKQLCEIIADEGNMKPTEAVALIDRSFECNSMVIEIKSDKRKRYSPRGWSSYSLLENAHKDRQGKTLSTRVLSTGIMKALERWGYVESIKSSQSIKLYRINGYKRDFLEKL